MVKENKDLMPVLFIGHGSPMNAIEDNEFTKVWKKIAEDIDEKFAKPKCILCISAHWLKDTTAVLSTEVPETIHDFYGFPEELYQVKYPVKNSLEYAKLIKDTITSVDVKLDDTWGIDHGTWTVLIHMYPKADIPVIQLSIDMDLPLETNVEIGKELSELRSRGVLIIGSGNIVHNLGMMRMSGGSFPWAIDFDEYIQKSLEADDVANLLNYKKHPSSRYAVPTNDHYIPLLYVVGASLGEKPKFYCKKIFYSSLSMTCVTYGL
jgi:4,5-DOPA dioxygenase extradiol